MYRLRSHTIAGSARWALLLALTLSSRICTYASTLYTNDGVLSARSEVQRWLINRARYAPEMEADADGLTNALAGGHPNYDVCEDSDGTNDFGSTTNSWAVWTRSLPPLAPNYRMNRAAENHARDMAETGLFQHYSPSSNYYPLGSSPAQRQAAEGYTNTVVGFYENITEGWQSSSGGYPSFGRTSPDIHADLFVDTSVSNRGHRQAILNANAREIGLGHWRTNYFSAPFYYTDDYDVQDYGRASSNHFFTDTIFFDANTNRVYDEGEGVAGIEVHLWRGTNEAAWYDASSASGNFALPINDLLDGATIEVELRNTNAASVRLTWPLGYLSVGDRSLPAGASWWVGAFTQPNGTTNVGFRACAPHIAQSIALGATNLNLLVDGLRRADYRIDYSDNGPSGAWSPLSSVTGTGDVTSISIGTASSCRVFRVILLHD